MEQAVWNKFYGLFHNKVHQSGTNPFSQLDLEKEVKEFIAWMDEAAEKGKFSRKYVSDFKRYIRYAEYLKDILELSNELPLSPDLQGKILKTLSNFAKFLDKKYGTDGLFHDFIIKLRRKLGLKWCRREPEGIHILLSFNDVVEAVRIARKVSFSVALKIYALAASGLRPIELKEITWDRISDNGLAFVGKKKGTKRSNFMFIPPKLLSILKQVRESKSKPFGISREYEFVAISKIREKIPHFNYYSLRHFNATYLGMKGLTDAKIDFIQGRASITVLRRHYLHMDDRAILMALKREYDEAIKELDNALFNALIGP